MMRTIRFLLTTLLVGTCLSAAPSVITVTVGKSRVIDAPEPVHRVFVGTGDIAEAVAVSEREILLNAKAPGETTLVLWGRGSARFEYDVKVVPSTAKLDAVMREVGRELPGQNISMAVEDGTVFLRGTAKDMASSERAVMLASTLGKPVNLLQVLVPQMEPQILLKVRFANIDRAAGQELGANIISTGATNTIGSTTTGQFSPPQPGEVTAKSAIFNLTDALNVFLFRPDLNLGATIRALQNRKLLEILAEPNLLAINGKKASFLAGGEYPYPVVQGGGVYTAVTIVFREFGVRLNFVPTITPRGTIRLQVAPEVSALDYSNGLVYQGFNIPALSVRRVNTEIELTNGQSFAIAGLLDNRVSETLSKIPGLGDIPVLGKLFQSRAINRNKSELLVVVTPELVRPVPQGAQVPELKMPVEFLKEGAAMAPQTPGADVTGPVPTPTSEMSVPAPQSQEAKPAGNQPSPLYLHLAPGSPSLPEDPLAVKNPASGDGR